jgi:iron complex outermembrane receptor protein
VVSGLVASVRGLLTPKTIIFSINSMNHFFLKSRALVCAALGLAHGINAESSEETVYQLDDYIVSAGPNLRLITDYIAPVNVQTAEELSRQSGSTLGAVLDWQPGVSSSSYGAGASRPILRGFDGPRVRILNAGIEAMDVSDTSPDHAVTLDPLLTERVEVLRGPSTLLYGSSAIGGAVNVIGKEMPRQQVDPKGYEAAIEARHDTVSDGDTLVGVATVGDDHWALTITGLDRDTNDYEIPDDAQEADAKDDRLENSFVETEQYSVGASWFFRESNRLGFSFSNYKTRYGVPGHGHHGEEEDDEGDHDEESVVIDLERNRYDVELELADVNDWVEALRMRLGYTDYEHSEGETTFEREGWELRTEAAHAPWWGIDEGVVGIQISDVDFSALGDESFTPASTTKTQALFVSEHIHGDVLHYEFGGRIERTDIAEQGNHRNYDELAISLAAGATWHIDEQNSLSLVLQRSQRNPTSTELYAEGPHYATSQYEFGDASLEQETAYGVDLTYRTTHESWKAEVSLFYTYFDDYIFSEELGYETDGDGIKDGDPGFDDDEALHTYQFTAVNAEFYGLEGQLDYTLVKSDNSHLQLSLMGDWIHASNEDTGDDLPRTPPMRIGSRLSWTAGKWDSGVELRYAFEQDNTGPEETSTDDYFKLNLDVNYRLDLGHSVAAVFFARADNLLDEDIRHHTSFLKDEAALPGRNVTIGTRLEF